jgi:IS5 family transposase
VLTVEGKAENVAGVTFASDLLRSEEEMVFADTRYRGVAKRSENTCNDVVWHVAMRRGKRRALGASKHARILDQNVRIKAQVRPKGGHAFPVVKRQFGYARVHYRGLAENTAQLRTLFAHANLWMARWALMNTG